MIMQLVTILIVISILNAGSLRFDISESRQSIDSDNNRNRNGDKCAARRCCNIRDGLTKSDIPNGLNCKELSDEKCGSMDEFCEWDCNPPKHKRNTRKLKRKYHGINSISFQKQTNNKLPNYVENDGDQKGVDPLQRCLSEGKFISIDDCGVEYEEEMDPNELEIFCKNHVKDNVSRKGRSPPSGNGDIEHNYYTEKRRLGVNGPDGRSQVTSSSFPYSAVLYMNYNNLDGSGRRCTAFMISPRWAMTASHCVQLLGDYYSNFRLYKNVISCDDKDGDYYTVNKVIAFFIKFGPEPATHAHDMALLRLDVEPNLGYFDFGDGESLSGEQSLNSITHPGDKPDCSKWYQNCIWDEWLDYTFKSHECDGAGGASGSPEYKYWESSNTRIVYGVYTASSSEWLMSTLITAAKYHAICGYIEEDNPGHCDFNSYSEIESFNSKCLDIHVDDLLNNGGKVQLWDCNNAIQQSWFYDSSTMEIKNEAGKCLDIHYDDYVSNIDGGLVQIWDCRDGSNQKWKINGDQITNLKGKCLDIHYDDYVSKINGGKVQMWDCNGQDNQSWNF